MDSGTLSLSLSSAGKDKDKAIAKDGSPLSLAGTKGAANIAAPKRAETAADGTSSLVAICLLSYRQRKFEHTP